MPRTRTCQNYQWWYMFLYIAHARDGRFCFGWYRLYMVFVLHAPSGFKANSALHRSLLNRNSFANMLTIAKTDVHGPLVFGTEKRHEPMGFEKKLCFKHVFSLQNTMKRRPFHNKIEVCGAMASSCPSQAHDLAKVDDFEILSP